MPIQPVTAGPYMASRMGSRKLSNRGTFTGSGKPAVVRRSAAPPPTATRDEMFCADGR